MRIIPLNKDAPESPQLSSMNFKRVQEKTKD